MKANEGAAQTRRLFFALWPDGALRPQLAGLAAAVLPSARGVVTATANLHATLLYLGPVAERRQLCAEHVADALAGRAFTLSLDHIGYFRRPQALWVGCRQLPEPLLGLVSGLRAGCASCGLSTDVRPFELHVTLVKKVNADPGRSPILSLHWEVGQFALIESLQEEGVTHYSPLRFWNLA